MVNHVIEKLQIVIARYAEKMSDAGLIKNRTLISWRATFGMRFGNKECVNKTVVG